LDGNDQVNSDEIIRAIGYCILIPGSAYVGVRIWNAAIMPDRLRRPVATFLWLQSAIYTLLMTGLFLSRLWHPQPALLWLNTFLIIAQACTVIIVLVRVSRIKRAVMLLVLAGLFSALIR
jgi:hypothetical protein